MTRALILACTVLAVVCTFEARAIRHLKTALAAERNATSDRAFASQAEELARTLAWLDAQRESSAAGAENRCEPENLLIENYLQRRAKGASEIEARAAVLQTLTAK